MSEHTEASVREEVRAWLEAHWDPNLSLREWRELHRQLLISCRELGLRFNQEPASYADIHQALLTGSLSLIGQRHERGEYRGARQLRFRIFPGSGVKKEPRWLMAAEIAETRRVYARGVAGIEPAWIERSRRCCRGTTILSCLTR